MPLPSVSVEALRARDDTALASLRSSLCTVGFVHVCDHGISREVLAALSASRAFFALSDETKAIAAHPRKGYIPVNGCVNAVRPPHLHEKFSCGRLPDSLVECDPYYTGPSDEAALYFGDPNHWPGEADAPEFRVAYEAAYRAFEGLSDELHGAIAVALGLPSDFFAPALRKHVTNLCALHYPSRAAPPDVPVGVAAAATFDDPQERVHPHTDPTSLTILYHEGGDASGLQVLDDSAGASGEWVDVGRHAGALIVNVGDILHFWTNGRLKSAKHRVLGRGWCDRLSLIYFCMPGYDTPIEAPAQLLAGAAPRFLSSVQPHLRDSRLMQTW